MRPYVEVRGSGPDVVLLHGWALHGGMWGPWLDELSRHARLHVLDLPGHGRSAWPGDLRGLTGLVRAVVPAVPRGAVLLGWSLGGMVALEIARQSACDVAALVLVASTPKFVIGDDWPHGLHRDVLDEFTRGLASDCAGTVRNFLALQASGDERSQETLRLLRRQLASHGAPDLEALAEGLSILRETDLRDALPQIACPALVMAGEHDRLTPPEAGRALAGSLPDARFRLIGRSGHAPFLSHAPQVLGEVLAFLGSHAAMADPSPDDAWT